MADEPEENRNPAKGVATTFTTLAVLAFLALISGCEEVRTLELLKLTGVLALGAALVAMLPSLIRAIRGK